MLPQNLPILNYHKIDNKPDVGITTRHPDDFMKDLAILKQQGFNSINFKHLKENKLPKKPVLISFDDAYESFYSEAFPILKEFQMTAVVFVPVNFIGKFNTWDVQIGRKKYRHMNESQLIEISKSGFEIGSHSLTHRSLTFLDEKSLISEIKTSKEVLQDITGENIISFSYPFGLLNNRVIKYVQEHYAYAVQLIKFKQQLNGTSLYSIPRINIYRMDSEKAFIKKLDFRNNTGLVFKNKLIQSGSWATVLLQQFKNFNRYN
ncbi:MAG: polysaccharide deacetylase family protein [Calditrichaeota bacterium]|nr:polysaccharide deacetylase family protein [Calditrichota bacterium]